MPALFDTAACTIPGGAGTTSKTYSSPINIGSGSNGTTDRGLVVAVVFVGAAAGTSSGVTATWNGVSMTQLATVGNGGDIFLFGLRAPDTGAHDLVLAWTGANQPSAVLLSCVGVDQTSDALAFPTAHRVTATGSASPNSIAVTNASGNIAFAAPADITKSATGRYYVDYVPLEVGHFSHQWTGTGTNPAVSEPVLFTVR